MTNFTSYTSPPVTGATKENLDPKLNLLAQMETPFYDSIGRGATSSRTPQLLEQGLNAAQDNAYVEGSDFTTAPDAGVQVNDGGEDGVGDNRYNAPSSRRSFDTQIFQKKYAVTGSEMATDAVTYQGKGRVAELAALAGMELKRDVEFATIGSVGLTDYEAGNTDSATVARRITNYWAQIDSSSTETPADADDNWADATNVEIEGSVNALAKKLWDNGGLTYKMGNPFVKNANMMLCSGTNLLNFCEYLDGKSNTFRSIDSSMSVQGQNFVKYVSPFGTFAVVPDPVAADTDVAIYNPGNWKWVTLRPTHVQEISKVGDSTRQALVMEGTLIHRNRKASGKITGITQS